jgi:hypothetical protein
LRRLLGYLAPTRALVPYLLFGLFVRFMIAPWTSWTSDMFPFFSATTDMLTGAGAYGHAVFSYPPLFAFLMYPFTFGLSLFIDPSLWGSLQCSMVDVAQLTGMITPFVTSPEFNLIAKAPIIMGDLLMGLVLFHAVRELRDERWGKRVFVLWFLNPLVIWISSISGQFDVFPALLTLLALVCFLRRSYVLTGLALGLGVLFKVYPAYLIVFYLIATVGLEASGGRGETIRRGLKNASLLVGGALISILTVLPLLLSGASIMELILRRASFPNFGGFNIWFAVPRKGGIEIPRTLTTNINVETTTVILSLILVFTIIIALLFIRYQKRRRERIVPMLVYSNALVVGTVILIQPVTNPQHLLWLFPFLLLYTVWESRTGRKLYLLTILGLLYFIGLQSFHAVLYPAAVYTPLLDVHSLNSAVEAYFTAEGVINRLGWTISTSFLGALVMGTLFLPRSLDPVEFASGWLLEKWRWLRER